jgi:hypothetical protein
MTADDCVWSLGGSTSSNSLGGCGFERNWEIAMRNPPVSRLELKADLLETFILLLLPLDTHFYDWQTQTAKQPAHPNEGIFWSPFFVSCLSSFLLVLKNGIYFSINNELGEIWCDLNLFFSFVCRQYCMKSLPFQTVVISTFYLYYVEKGIYFISCRA